MILSHLLAVAIAVGPADVESTAKAADERYARGEFAEASARYADAYQQAGEPGYLWGWAQSERRAGNCPRAVELYREFVELPVSDAAKDAAKKNALRCGDDLSESAAELKPSAPEPPPPHPPVPEPTVEGSQPERPWAADPVAISLLAGGASLAVAAIVLGVDSGQHRRLADAATIEASYTSEVRRARRTGTAAIICASVSAAALVGAAVRYVIVARRSPRTHARVRSRGFVVRF